MFSTTTADEIRLIDGDRSEDHYYSDPPTVSEDVKNITPVHKGNYISLFVPPRISDIEKKPAMKYYDIFQTLLTAKELHKKNNDLMKLVLKCIFVLILIAIWSILIWFLWIKIRTDVYDDNESTDVYYGNNFANNSFVSMNTVTSMTKYETTTPSTPSTPPEEHPLNNRFIIVFRYFSNIFSRFVTHTDENEGNDNQPSLQKHFIILHSRNIS